MKGQGSWLESVKFDGQDIWNMSIKPIDSWHEVENKLTSDSSFRQDLQSLVRGDIENAQM